MKNTIIVLVVVSRILFSSLISFASDTTIKGTTSDATKASLEVTNSSNTSLLFVRNDGSVGIGTTSPGSLLNIRSAAGSHSELRIDTGDTTTVPCITFFRSGSGNASIQYRYDNLGLHFQTMGIAYPANTKVSLLDNGNVGIGTTSPGTPLHVSGSAVGANLFLGRFTNVGDGGAAFIELQGPVAGRASQLGVSSAGDFIITVGATLGSFSNERLRITVDGNVGIGTTSPGYKLQVGNAGDTTEARANAWNLLSDIRLKTNLIQLNGALDKISNINGYYFNWKEGTDKRRHIGVISQEVEKVLPEVISLDPEGYKSIDYGKLVPLLIEGVKELKAVD